MNVHEANDHWQRVGTAYAISQSLSRGRIPGQLTGLEGHKEKDKDKPELAHKKIREPAITGAHFNSKFISH
jgi:hypothetical protein